MILFYTTQERTRLRDLSITAAAKGSKNAGSHNKSSPFFLNTKVGRDKSVQCISVTRIDLK